MFQINYQEKPLEIDLCKSKGRIETDYSQGAVMLFFDVKAPCGKDGNFYLLKLRISIFYCT